MVFAFLVWNRGWFWQGTCSFISDFRGQVWKGVWKIIYFGFENRAAHPHPKFWGVSPGQSLHSSQEPHPPHPLNVYGARPLTSCLIRVFVFQFFVLKVDGHWRPVRGKHYKPRKKLGNHQVNCRTLNPAKRNANKSYTTTHFSTLSCSSHRFILWWL